MNLDIEKLTNIAIEAALEAGKAIQKYMKDDYDVLENKNGDSLASQVLTEIDLKSEKIILSYLLPTCKTYDLGLLTEEQEDDKSRFQKDFFWCIDPIDGTLAFIKKQQGFSVSIALISQEGTPLIGVVFDPSTNNLYHAIKGKGAFKNNSPWEKIPCQDYLTYTLEKPMHNLTYKKEFQAILKNEKEKLGLTKLKQHFSFGSVLNAITIAENRPGLMMKFPKKEAGGGSFWDYAATTCIFNELNFQATDFHGIPLQFNKLDTYMNKNGIFFSSI